jgi:hypothetical protein
VLGELPDRDERAQNQAWIHYELARIATFFFGANQKGVSGLLLVLRLICRVRFFIHDPNFTRQVLAAMTIIIKFLPHHIAAGDRVARSRARGRRKVRVDRERRDPVDKIARCEAMLGFVIDWLD